MPHLKFISAGDTEKNWLSCFSPPPFSPLAFQFSPLKTPPPCLRDSVVKKPIRRVPSPPSPNSPFDHAQDRQSCREHAGRVRATMIVRLGSYSNCLRNCSNDSLSSARVCSIEATLASSRSMRSLRACAVAMARSSGSDCSELKASAATGPHKRCA